MKTGSHRRLQVRARRLDMYVQKSPARDTNRLDFGRFALIDTTKNAVVCGGGPLGLHSCTLDEIEEHLVRLEGVV